jgi:hypothetical protein
MNLKFWDAGLPFYAKMHLVIYFLFVIVEIHPNVMNICYNPRIVCVVDVLVASSICFKENCVNSLFDSGSYYWIIILLGLVIFPSY